MKTNLLMTLLVVIFLSTNIFVGERMTIGNGLGYDGQFHADIAKDWINKVLIEKRFYNSRLNRNFTIDRYHIRRVLPGGIIHYSLRFFNVPLTNQNIIKAFLFLNMLLISMITFCWGITADRLSISNGGKWLGFMGLFLNFALTFNLYYPTLTDVPAFACGMLLIMFYIMNNGWALLAITLIGAFIWPTMLVMGLILYVFPTHKMTFQKEGRISKYIAAIIAISFTVTAIIIKYYIGHRADLIASESLMPLSFLLLGLFLYKAYSAILDCNYLYRTKDMLGSVKYTRLLLAAVIYIQLITFSIVIMLRQT